MVTRLLYLSCCVHLCTPTDPPSCNAQGTQKYSAAADEVRASFLHAWLGYKRHAWGEDELMPLSNTSNNRWGGLAITMIDALDTMRLMGLDEQYAAARAWLLEHLPARLKADREVPFFEVTIRGLGGLLGAHTLTLRDTGVSDDALLRLAADLGRALLPAFASPSGVPYCTVNLRHGTPSCPVQDLGEAIPLAEAGSVQLEFAALGEALGEPAFARTADAAVHMLRARINTMDGLFPSHVRPATASPASRQAGFGAGADSFYETLLKRWLQGGGRAPGLLSAYHAAIRGLRSRLLSRSHPSGLAFVGRHDGAEAASGLPQSILHQRRGRHEHLSCFLPGLIALGARHAPTASEGEDVSAARRASDPPPTRSQRASPALSLSHRSAMQPCEQRALPPFSTQSPCRVQRRALDQAWQLARELLHTCSELYARASHGLGAERVVFYTAEAKRSAASEWEAKGFELQPPEGDYGDFSTTDSQVHVGMSPARRLSNVPAAQHELMVSCRLETVPFPLPFPPQATRSGSKGPSTSSLCT